MVRAMLHEKNMPYFLWADVVHTAVYLLNRSPTKALDNITPFEAYSGRKPSIGHLKVFGSLCFVHVPAETRQNLDAKSVKGVFVGYAIYEKGYRTEMPIAGTNVQDQSRIVIDPSLHEVTEVEDSYPSPCISSQIEDQERNIHGTTEITRPYDHTPVKWRNISDILAQCNLCIVELEKYEEAA
ncbi:hypothetical protein L3X38_041171 [Prunus dulcis]|uniref:Retroviral polymerase SH3-like domain-containing protein n=1 Tax=Prunus dulcis TaxID=3755 RepID=A0AAD4UTH8_PRUDU|nr:hypothetical protein L3X38_041171 [Prunus dulcis]